MREQDNTMDKNRIKILVISGNLRKNSSNTNILYAMSNLRPENTDF